MKGFGGSNLTPTYPEAAGKENRGRAVSFSTHPATISRVRTFDDTAIANSRPSNSGMEPKSRMRVPFRNILTRFK